MKKNIKELEIILKEFIILKKKYLKCFNKFLDESEIVLKNTEIKKGKIDFSNLAIFNSPINNLNTKYNVESQISSKKITSNIKELKELVNKI